MSEKAKRLFSLLAAGFFACLSAFAQDGTYSAYSPYSTFALGNRLSQGSAYNKTMGGVGIATRNKKYLNYLNPASVTARDSLAVMIDFSMYQSNVYYKQYDATSAMNLCNLNDIAFSFPLYKSSAFMVGIAPYSSAGYGFLEYLDDPEVLAQAGRVAKTSSGQGDIYQLFAAAGVTFWNRLSLGVQWQHYFGSIEKTTEVTMTKSAYTGLNSGYDIYINGNSLKLGLQYEQPIGNFTVGVGATYSFGGGMNGYVTDYSQSSSTVSDTIRFNIDTLKASTGRVKFANELGLGISLRYGEKWRAEFNYIYSDWSNTGIGEVPGFSNKTKTVDFRTTKSEEFRVGFEYVPNMNDIRYYMRRCAYRVGAYYEKSYIMLNGQQVNAFGVTLGATLPIFKLYNGLTVGVDLGQRGSLTGSLTRERYVNFTVGLNAYDLWFHRHQYQ